MGGTISKLCGNSAVGGNTAAADRKDRKESKAEPLERPTPDRTGDGPSLGSRNASRPRKPGEIAPGVWQYRSNQPRQDFEDNLALLVTHRRTLSPAELEEIACELAESHEQGVRFLAETLMKSGGSFTPEQLKSFGRGMALSGGEKWRLSNPQWPSGDFFARGIPRFEVQRNSELIRNAQWLTAGVLTQFQGEPDTSDDRLSQQIQAIVGAVKDEKGDIRFQPMGALVLERGLDNIDLAAYERICKAAALNLYHSSEEDVAAFASYIPGADSTRAEIADCHARWNKVSRSRSDEPGEPFKPEGHMGEASGGRVFYAADTKSPRRSTSQSSATPVRVHVTRRPAAPAVTDPTPTELASAMASDPAFLAQARALYEMRKPDAKS